MKKHKVRTKDGVVTAALDIAELALLLGLKMINVEDEIQESSGNGWEPLTNTEIYLDVLNQSLERIDRILESENPDESASLAHNEGLRLLTSGLEEEVLKLKEEHLKNLQDQQWAMIEKAVLRGCISRAEVSGLDATISLIMSRLNDEKALLLKEKQDLMAESESKNKKS